MPFESNHTYEAKVVIAQLYVSVNEWLRYLEAKNAALIAFCGVAFPTLITLQEKVGLFGQVYMSVAAVFLGLSILISLISFVPFYDKKAVQANNKVAASNQEYNILFFGDIGAGSFDIFVEKLIATGLIQQENSLEAAYAQQIHINSMICLYKARLFKTAIFFAIAGVFTPIVGALLYAYHRAGPA